HEDTPVMPPNQDRIPDEQLGLIQQWIEGGILENSGSKARAKKKKNLAFVSLSKGKPDGPAAMPETAPLKTVVVTERPATTTAIACSPWAPLVAIAGQRQVVLYHLDSGDLLGVLPFEEGVAQSLRFSRDGSFLIVGGGEHAVRGLVAIFDVRSGERVASIGDELDVVLDGDATSTLGRVALGGPTKILRIFDAEEGAVLHDLKKHTDWILSVAFSPDDVLIASSDRSAGLVVWEVATGSIYLDLSGHKAAVNAVAWRDDSNVLASGSDDGTVKLWDMHSGKQIKSINVGGAVHDVDFDHQGRLITSAKNKRVAIWDGSGKKIKEFKPMREPVLEAAVGHEGKRVVYGDWSGEILNVLVDKPSETLTMASNPPDSSSLLLELTSRLSEAEKTLADDQERQSLAAKNTAKCKAKVSQAKERVSRLRAESEKQITRLGELEIAVKQAHSKNEQLASQARDLQDQWVAARVGLKNGSVSEKELAAVERDLGEHLMALAERRSKRLADVAEIETTRPKIGSLTKQIEKAEAEAERLQGPMGLAEEKLGLIQKEVKQGQGVVAKLQRQVNSLASEGS
ncbi:MAG: hypothetical protein AAF989_12140, partial [Planctomycetota bacterium]